MRRRTALLIAIFSGALIAGAAVRDLPTQTVKLLPPPSPSAQEAHFGRSVALDADTMVVGVVDDERGADAGAVDIFYRNPDDGTWGRLMRLTASDGAPHDSFGSAVALDGDTLIVAAVLDDDAGVDSGSVSVFYRDQGGPDHWGAVAVVTAPDGTGGECFGTSVAVDGDTLVVGATGDDDNGIYSGSVYTFERNVGGTDAWGQTAKLTPDDGDDQDRFGNAVAVDGDTIVVGARADDEYGYFSGSVYLFDRNSAGTWGQTAKIVPIETGPGLEFGRSVTIEDDTLIVGAANARMCFVFERDVGGTGSWGQTAVLQANDSVYGDGFGTSVVLDGDTVIIGADCPGSDNFNIGSATVFIRDPDGGAGWTEVARLHRENQEYRDLFGHTVAIDGDTVAVAAPWADANGVNSGTVSLFGRDAGGPGAWGRTLEMPAPDAPTARSFHLGGAVAVDGDILVAGMVENDENGDRSGSALIFERIGVDGDWEPTAKLIPSDGAAGDRFGSSVAVDGDTVVVGAPYDDLDGWDFGSAFVFERDHGGPGNWGEVVKLVASNGTAHDTFGRSVGIDGDLVVVGSPQGGADHDGVVSLYSRNQGGIEAWGEIGAVEPEDISSVGDFGRSVAIADDVLVVGAPNTTPIGGVAFVFHRESSNLAAWQQVTVLYDTDPSWTYSFGRSVAVEGDTIVVGAPGTDAGVGSATVFGRHQGGPDSWGKISRLAVPDGNASENFGESVTVTGDSIVIGSPDRHGFGAAFLYTRNPGGTDVWEMTGEMTDSGGVAGDHFGRAVAADGNTAVIGVPDDEGASRDSGSIVIFTGIAPNPTVVAVETNPPLPGGLGPDQWVPFDITGFRAVFDRNLENSPGDSDPGDCTNPANWLLVSAGPNGAIETVSCADGPGGDDFTILLDDFSADASAGTSVDFNVTGPPGQGRYALLACGTLRSEQGAVLDGNFDGWGGDDYLLPFGIDLSPPETPSGLTTSTHDLPSSTRIIVTSWIPATDIPGGIEGYAWAFTSGDGWACDGVVDGTSAAASSVPLDDGSWWFHVCSVDRAGNRSGVASLGPMVIDGTPPEMGSAPVAVSHEIGRPSIDTTIDIKWVPAEDETTTVEGYGVEFTHAPSWTCDGIRDTGASTATSPPLEDGPWFAHVCAVDEVGNWSDALSSGPYLIDTTAPVVERLGSEAETADGVLSEGESALAAITLLTVEFPEPVEPGVFRLIDRGPDGTLNTAGCFDRPTGDDGEIAIDETSVSTDGRTVSVTVGPSEGLPVGRYALMVCDVEDIAGNLFEGPSIGRFQIGAANRLENPNFDDELAGTWETGGDGTSTIEVVNLDPTTESSGVVLFETTDGVNRTLEIFQCVDVFEGRPYGIGARAVVESGASDAPVLTGTVRFFRNAGCTDPIGESGAVIARGDSGLRWTPRRIVPVRTPAEALSAQVAFVVEGGTASEFTLSLDETSFFEDLIFVEDFESGDLSWWNRAP